MHFDDRQRDDVSLRRQRGVSLVETLFAVVVLMVGFLALTQTAISSQSLKNSADEGQRVHAAMQQVCSEVRAVAHGFAGQDDWAAQVAAAFSPGGSRGDRFAVVGLQPVSGQSSVGSIQVVVDETATDAALGVVAGMPRDLDGDGAVASSNATATARLLPVVVTLEWVVPAGTRSVRKVLFVARS